MKVLCGLGVPTIGRWVAAKGPGGLQGDIDRRGEQSRDKMVKMGDVVPRHVRRYEGCRDEHVSIRKESKVVRGKSRAVFSTPE
jgi:hypothetical protein